MFTFTNAQDENTRKKAGTCGICRTGAGLDRVLPSVFPGVGKKSSQVYINYRQPNGSLSKVLSKLAVGVRVVGDGETQRREHEREEDQEETRHRVLACVPSSTGIDRRE